MIKLNGYLIAISVLVVLVSSETVDNRTTPHNDRLPTQPPNPLPQEGTTTTVRFLNQGTPGAPTTQPPPATTTQPVGRGPTPVRSTQVSPARQNQTPARATSSSSRPPTPTARSPSPARQGQTPAGPSTSRPPTPTRSSSMRPTPTRPASSGSSGSSTSRRTTPQNQEVSSGSMRTTPRSTPTQGSPTSSGSRRTTPASTTGGSTSMSSPTLSPTTILTPEFTTPTPSQGISSGASSELSTAGVTTLGVTSAGVSTAGVSTETAGVSTTTPGSSSMSSSPSTSPVVSTSLSTESSSGSPSTTTPISSSTSPGSTTVESTSSSSVSTSVSTASSSSASSSGSSSASSESTSTSASTTPTSTASTTSTSVSSPTTPTSTASSTSTTLPDTPSTPTTPTSTPSSTTPSTTPTSMSSTPSTTPRISGDQLIHTQIMFCIKYRSIYLPNDPISYQDYIQHLMMAIASTCGVGPDRILRLEMVEDPPSGNTLIQFDVVPGPGLSTKDLVMKIQEQVSNGQFTVTDKIGNVLNVQCSLPIYPMCPWTDYGPCPRDQCQHGGICRVAVSCQYFCECRSGWFGQFCEKGAETTKPPEPVKKKDNLWLLWLLIVPLVLLGLLALLLLFCCCHRCCCWGASAGPRKVQIIEEDIYQDVPACSQHGSIRSCRSMHSARPSSIYAVNPPQMASDAGSTYYHALGRPFAVAFSDNTFSAIGYATNDMGIYNSSGRKMLPAASCCGDDEIEVIMNNPGRRGSCCGSMISETGSGYHSALGNRYAVAYNDRAFNTYSSMPRMGSIRHYN